MEDRHMNNPIPEIHLANRPIAPNHPPVVIAEAGVNHDGRIETALRLVDAAQAAGADAVKFQAFRADRLATRHAKQVAYQQTAAAADSQVEMLRRLELSPADFARIRHHCDQAAIEFLATPFSPQDLQVLLDVGVRAIKIASPDIVNRPLLDAACRTSLPVLLSTGASETAEIDAAVDLLRNQAGVPLVLLHCVSSYPTDLQNANLRRIAALHARYGCPVGYSDHTAGSATSQIAVAAGASVLEKHFTLDRTAPGPDHAFSLQPDDLAEYIRLARHAHQALGTGDLDLSEVEREVRLASRASVTAAGDIPAGTTITRDMLAARRPGTGISPWQIDEVVGRTSRSAIPAETPITPDLLA